MDGDKWVEFDPLAHSGPGCNHEELSQANPGVVKTISGRNDSEDNAESLEAKPLENRSSSDCVAANGKCRREVLGVVPKKSKYELSSSTGSSKEDISRKLHKAKSPYSKSRIIGDPDSGDKIVRSMYITTCSSTGDKLLKISATVLEKELKKIVVGKVRLRETLHGIIASFNREEDCDRATKLDMSKIFGNPIAVWNIPQTSAKHHRTALIRDIPWCVPIKEIEGLLKCQGVQATRLSRVEGSSVRVEVRNPSSLERLLSDGLNFFGCTALPVVLEPSEDADVVQCYKCQRFWHTAAHCPYHVRCVRCGEKHDVRDCMRSRKNPVCCLCGESHHAAYKLCPVRLQHLNFIQVEFALYREAPTHRS